MKNFILILLFSTFFLFSCSFDNQKGNKYLLAYGVSDYFLINNLAFTDNDAIDVTNSFREKGYNVFLRINDGANSDDNPASIVQFEEDINYFSNILEEDDTFIFYYSGHGGRYNDFRPDNEIIPGNEPEYGDTEDEWIFLYGSMPSIETDVWDNYAIRDDILMNYISQLNSNKKIVIIDACNSGGFIGDSFIVDGISTDFSGINNNGYSNAFGVFIGYNGKTADVDPNSAIVIGAAGEREFSYEYDGFQNGVFTYFFLESLDNGDQNNDNFISLFEAYSYTANSINAFWNEQYSESLNFYPHISGVPYDIILF